MFCVGDFLSVLLASTASEFPSPFLSFSFFWSRGLDGLESGWVGPWGGEGFVLPSLLLFLFSLGLDGLASGLGGALVGGKVPLPVFGSFFLASTVSECPFFSLPWSFFCPFSFLLALGLPCVPFFFPCNG